MMAGRWLVGLGALFIAGLALYVLISAKPPTVAHSVSSRTRPAKQTSKPDMDQIDAKSRDAMRELLRESK